MRFIPTHCDRCGRSNLTPERAFDTGVATCVTCVERMHTLPGESYASYDVPLFQQLESAIRQANLGPETVRFLRTELLGRGRGAPGQALRSVIGSVPALAIFEIIVGSDPAALRKAEGILLILLDGLSRSPTTEARRDEDQATRA